MLIQGNNNLNFLKPNFQTQNGQLQKLIRNINEHAQQKSQNFDSVELSLQAKNLQKEKAEKTEKKDQRMDYENSPMNGSRTQAEWGESAVNQQYNGVNSMKNALGYQKHRLENILSKIDEYQKIANGDYSETENITMSQERAAQLVERYKESIRTDFSEEIEGIIKFYGGWAKSYDEYSGGMASQIIGDVLGGISAESLGLDKLSNDPAEIMKALDKGMESLDALANSIADAYSKAGGKNLAEPLTPDTSAWSKRIRVENLMTEMVTINESTPLTGEVLKLDHPIKWDSEA